MEEQPTAAAANALFSPRPGLGLHPAAGLPPPPPPPPPPTMPARKEVVDDAVQEGGEEQKDEEDQQEVERLQILQALEKVGEEEGEGIETNRKNKSMEKKVNQYC